MQIVRGDSSKLRSMVVDDAGWRTRADLAQPKPTGSNQSGTLMKFPINYQPWTFGGDSFIFRHRHPSKLWRTWSWRLRPWMTPSTIASSRPASGISFEVVVLSSGWWFGFFTFPCVGKVHHPNWRNHIFQRGGSTTNQSCFIHFSIPQQMDLKWCRWTYMDLNIDMFS